MIATKALPIKGSLAFISLLIRFKMYLFIIIKKKKKIPFFSKSCIVYKYSCPECSKSYIGKTETTLHKRCQQHGWEQKGSSIFRHFSRCPDYQHIQSIYMMQGNLVIQKEFQIAVVRENIQILHTSPRVGKG